MNKNKSKLQTRSNSLFLTKLINKDDLKSRLSVDCSQINQSKSQKAYLKSQYQSNKNPFTQSKNNQNEKKTSKLIKTKKPSLSIHRYSHRKTFEITEASSNIQLANSSIKNMMNILQKNFIITQKQSNNFTIKTQDLKRLLQTALLFKTNCLQERLLKDNQQFNDCLVGLWKAVEGQINKNNVQSFNYFNKISIKVTRDDYQYELKQQKQKLLELQTLRKQKEAALSDLNQSLRDSYSHKQAIKLTIHNKETHLSDLYKRCEHQERVLLHLEAQTAKKQQFLRSVQEREQAIFNFVNSQDKSKMIKMASEQYKQIQSDLYEYAVYLQANQLASSLTYEHLPIVCHTHKLQEELNALCKCLLYNERLGLDEKCFKMKEFVLQVHERYRKQSVEMKKMMDFKTKWIIKYVDKMKMWLNNWELKQEYLKNLRIQYLIIHEKIIDLLTNSRGKKHGQTCWQSNPEERQKVIELFLKLNENFEMGNSFY